MDLTPLRLSVEVAIMASVVTFVLGLYLAWIATLYKSCQGVLDSLLTLPMVLPPTVIGLFLLMLFGSQSKLGRWLDMQGISVVFNLKGALIAAIVVALPLMYRTVRAGFESMDQDIIAAARTLGMKEFEIFIRVLVPNAYPSIIAGLVLAFARALGEFGATMMLAGNIPGKTQTMSIAIYTAVQAGDYQLAYKWALVMCSFSLLVLGITNGYVNKIRRKQGRTKTCHFM